MTTQDVINYEPESFQLIEDEEKAEYFYHETYFPILMALRDGPLTVKEIIEKYNEIAKEEKSDKSLYRYLNELEKVDLVVKAGKRIDMEKTASETLYCRTARVYFLNVDKPSKTCDEKEENIMNKKLAELIAVLDEFEKPSSEEVAEFMCKITKKVNERIFKLFREYNKEVSEVFKDLNFKEIGYLTQQMLNSVLLLLYYDEFEEEIKQVFPTKKN